MSELRRIGVLGAGTMGAGIAQVAAERGLEVMLHDPIPGASERAEKQIGSFLARKVEKGQLDRHQAAEAVGRIRLVATLEQVAKADLVVEAIPEELELKREAFRRLDAAAPAETILATNTSSLPVARIANATAHPEREIGRAHV